MASTYTVDWGDIPTWLSAVTTLGALVAAAVVVRIEMRRDRRGVERAERAEQADKVAAWYDHSYAPNARGRVGDGPLGGDGGGERGGAGRILLRNGSDLPVYNVFLNIYSEAPGILTPPLKACPPGDTHLEVPPGVVGPYERMTFRLLFTDAAGRSWMRWTDGKLGRLTEDALEWYRDEARSMFEHMSGGPFDATQLEDGPAT